MKAHIFRELVNDLRDIAKEKHNFQSLREIIAGRLRQDIQITHDPAVPQGKEVTPTTPQGVSK